jgi:hypothetical protein
MPTADNRQVFIQFSSIESVVEEAREKNLSVYLPVTDTHMFTVLNTSDGCIQLFSPLVMGKLDWRRVSNLKTEYKRESEKILRGEFNKKITEHLTPINIKEGFVQD